MFKKIVEFFTGKKTAPEVVAPGGAPYKVETPAATTPIPVTVEPPAAPEKKKRTFVKKPAAIAAPAEKKPRAKKTTQ